MAVLAVVLVGLLCLFALPPPAKMVAEGAALEVEDQSKFNYVEGSSMGPSNWGNIKAEWADCKNGRMQSPIDLFNLTQLEVVPRFGAIEWFYNPGNVTLVNRGRDILLKWMGDDSKIRINGTDYILRQSHYHYRSEHTIFGRKFDLELHLVHESTDPTSNNPIAVVGVLYRLGEADEFLASLSGRIRMLSNSTILARVRAGIVDPSNIRMGGNTFFRYMGSLTTPPCTEQVIWTVSTTIRTVSQEQINVLREAVDDGSAENARPIQPLNGRTIGLYLGLLLNLLAG